MAKLLAIKNGVTYTAGVCAVCGHKHLTSVGRHAEVCAGMPTKFGTEHCPCNSFVPADGAAIREQNRLAVAEVLQSPPAAVLSFGQRKGDAWEKWCRALAAMLEANAQENPPPLRAAFVARGWLSPKESGVAPAKPSEATCQHPLRFTDMTGLMPDCYTAMTTHCSMPMELGRLVVNRDVAEGCDLNLRVGQRWVFADRMPGWLFRWPLDLTAFYPHEVPPRTTIHLQVHNVGAEAISRVDAVLLSRYKPATIY